jgi:hypothetical protein
MKHGSSIRQSRIDVNAMVNAFVYNLYAVILEPRGGLLDNLHQRPPGNICWLVRIQPKVE